MTTAAWRSAGACLHADPDLFFPISMTGRAVEQVQRAKAICASCPVLAECKEFARIHDAGYGIWGGTTPEERRRSRRREQRRQRAEAPARTAG
jgi:WhiB family redox-sensing transcriptional regulator